MNHERLEKLEKEWKQALQQGTEQTKGLEVQERQSREVSNLQESHRKKQQEEMELPKKKKAGVSAWVFDF